MINISQKAQNALLSTARYIKFKLEVYFDGNDSAPTDITSDVISFDTTEECSSSTSLPFGGVSYNELSVVLDNMHQNYTISNTNSVYNGKLIANKLVKVTYQVEVEEDIFEDIPGGMFYTDAWSSDNNALTATLVCYDIMSLYGALPVNRFKVKRNVKVKQAYDILFSNVGIPKDKYKILDNVTGTLDYFWCTGDTLNVCLDDLSTQSFTNVYVNRFGVIVVASAINPSESAISISDNNVIMTSKTDPSYKNIYSDVLVKYSAVNTTESSIITIDNITIEPGENIISNQLFSSSPVLSVSSIVLRADGKAYIKSYNYDDKSISINVVSNTSEPIKASIEVTGNVLTGIDTCLSVSNNIVKSSVSGNIIEVQLPIVCNGKYAEYYGKKILDMHSRYVSGISLDIVGLPHVEISDVVSISSDTSSVNDNFIVKKITNSFLEGLTGVLEARYI